MHSAVIAVVALLLVLALAASPARAATELSSIFESVARTAEALEVESAEPVDWFPVRGIVDFGEADARFGAWRGGHRHEGQDVFAKAGTSLVAVRAGTVVETGDDGGRGNYIAIWSSAARRTFVYLHMLRPARLRPGESVRMGERVGAVGCTGSCWGDHLHFELRSGRGTTGRAIDPLPLLRRLAARRDERE
jgi:murein DD-endopeptidase MepM/ murein hydrolase activator NlpD